MIKYLISFLFICCVFPVVLASRSLAETSDVKASFVRINKNSDGTYQSFDTLISSYKKGEVQVDLIAAVHVAEVDYYTELNKRFEGYDALLYELIADPDVNVADTRKDKEGNLLTYLQTSLKNVLGLEFQLDHINYEKTNFVHADMTPEDFMDSMQKKNESIWSILLKVLMNSQEISESSNQIAPEIFMMQMLLSPNRKMTLRKIMAAQFQDIDKFLEVFEGEQGTTIITERNKVAFNVLSREIKSGKKKLGIFYGGGHMPDLEKRITRDLGFTKSGEVWLQAWKLS